eukprot:TRINITY_DN7294_c0_g1_i1.p1 TRINITY_DN7294_c0_g1~~TRINITY_DN7294_c0_g1_i1.p1  ORF type:complete len:492 (-),score=19.78 TRINITY_DN7294_c0_g1_i1:162-1637(-)
MQQHQRTTSPARLRPLNTTIPPSLRPLTFPEWVGQVYTWRLIAACFWAALATACAFFCAHFICGFSATFVGSVASAVGIILHLCFLRRFVSVNMIVRKWPSNIWEHKGRMVYLVICVMHAGLGLTGSIYLLDETMLNMRAHVFATGCLLGALYFYAFNKMGLFVLVFPALQRGRLIRFKAILSYSIVLAVFIALVAVGTSSLISLTVLRNSFHTQSSIRWDSQFYLFVLQFYASAIIIFTWNISYQLLAIIHTQAISFSQGERWERLFEGVTYTKDPFIQYLALLELATKSKLSSRLREAVFRDHTGNLWNTLAIACCQVIDNCTKRIDYEIYECKRQEEAAKERLLRKKTQIKETLLKPLSLPWSTRVENIFYDYNLVMWSIQGIGNLCIASRSEDKFGIVQTNQGLLGTLCSLLACYTAVRKLVATAPIGKPNVGSYDIPFIEPKPHVLASVLESVLYGLATTFYEDLGTLQFPSCYRSTLQALVDMVL